MRLSVCASGVGCSVLLLLLHLAASATAEEAPFFANGAFVRSPDLDLSADEAVALLSERSQSLKEVLYDKYPI